MELFKCVGVLSLYLLTGGASVAAQAADTARPQGKAHRSNIGAIVVLDLYGSYLEMGRQAALLLGEERAAAVALWQVKLAESTRRIPIDQVVPAQLFAESIESDLTGYGAYLNGVNEIVGMSSLGLYRIIVADHGGSTSFIARGRRTKSGGAIIGRNVDWTTGMVDFPALVSRFHPSNSDLAHAIAFVPFSPFPVVAINEAGFAISLNYFFNDPKHQFGVSSFAYRRAAQTARTVNEAIAIITGYELRAGPALVALADPHGDSAYLECRRYGCVEVEFDAGDMAIANHAQHPEMVSHDFNRSSNSFRRLAAMQAAVAAHKTPIDVAAAVDILRDRSEGVRNDAVVANGRVLNSVVLEPASRAMWHATGTLPTPMSGSYVKLTVPAGGAGDMAQEIPADGRFDPREAIELRRLSDVVTAYHAGDFEGAAPAVSELVGSPWLQPDRLAYLEGLIAARRGRNLKARAAFARISANNAPPMIALYALAIQTEIAANAADQTDLRARLATRLREMGPQRHIQTLKQCAKEECNLLADAPDLQIVDWCRRFGPRCDGYVDAGRLRRK